MNNPQIYFSLLKVDHRPVHDCLETGRWLDQVVGQALLVVSANHTTMESGDHEVMYSPRVEEEPE